MGLNTELLITLQLIKGLGNKTILNYSKSVNIDSAEDLAKDINSINKGRFANITTEDIQRTNRVACRIMAASELEGIGIISYFELSFPQQLRECVDETGKEDAPIVLYYRGNLKALEKPGVAVIGTREPTPNGIKAGIFFSAELAKRNYNIVSGLALGCDTTGHKGALSVGGTTTAFLANSLSWDSIYPKENLDLAKEIVDNGGLLLSEYYIGQNCGRYAFVARDRLQAGLSYATIVIQTGVLGGTMHAVNATLVSKKPLFMVKFNKAEDLNNSKTFGNVKLLSEKKAQALNSDTFEDAVKIIQQQTSIKNRRYTIEEIDNNNQTQAKMKSIIFDLDLTLVDTTCLEEARHNRNWREAYSLIPKTKLYEGMENVFDFIRKNNIKVAIVSTAPRPYVEKIIAYYHIPAQYVIGYHDAKPIKPHPSSMLKALELMEEKATDVISFGDRVIDIEASNAASIESVACLWGTKEMSKLVYSKAAYKISAPIDIISLITK